MEVRITAANFQEEVLGSKIPALVDFWAEWCAPCRMVAPVLEEIAREYKDKIKVCKVNVDEASDIASEYGVMSIPTLALFKDREIVDKAVGVVPKTDLAKMIDRHIK